MEVPPRVALRHRPFVELKKTRPTDQFPSKVHGAGLVEVTYAELGRRVAAFGRGLRRMGMEPKPRGGGRFDEAAGRFALLAAELAEIAY